MLILLDLSPSSIADREQKFQREFGQLRTPLSRHKLSGRPYALDNGCFTSFRFPTWRRMLDEAREQTPLFVCLPDVVGSAQRTIELFHHFKPMTDGLPRALVLQDGVENINIPWDDLDAVFVGGTDEFKLSRPAIAACKTAFMLGKWVHFGRVNTPDRLVSIVDVADSIDGSGLSKYDHMLKACLEAMDDHERQHDLSLQP